ncbi:MAG: ParB N-terminal domain-containing protein [Halioglobus sp.]|nr:ParB N-terminal domain-containing protein [Halioglobus sp.]
MRQVEMLPPEAIAKYGGRRAVNPESVARLMESMQSVGLRTPITVRIVDNHIDTDGVVVDGQPVVVTGAHRLEAAKRLGWEKIECFIFDGDSEIDAELWEIDENLCRHELTPTEQAEHLAKRKELWEARERDRVSGQVDPKLSVRGRENEGRPEGFATETAKTTGKSKESINRDVRRAHDVCQEARDLIRGTKLDTGAMLDKLSKLEPAAQIENANIQLEALADKERRALLKEEKEAREKEARQLREEARGECCNFLCTMMSGRDWATLIDLVERAGGSIKSDHLRRWQSP